MKKMEKNLDNNLPDNRKKSRESGGRRIKRSTIIPVMLLVYLAVMSYIGRGELEAGNYLYYFSIIGLTLLAIVGVHFSLKRRERLREQRQDGNKER